MAQKSGKEGEKEMKLPPEINLIYATGVPAWIARESRRYQEDAEGFMFLFPAEAGS